MRVHIEQVWAAQSVRIYVYQQSVEGCSRELRLREGGREWHEVGPGDTSIPTLELPTDALEAIVEAASDFLPPSAGQAAALDDTRKVRDRLLTLVETLATQEGVTS